MIWNINLCKKEKTLLFETNQENGDNRWLKDFFLLILCLPSKVKRICIDQVKKLNICLL